MLSNRSGYPLASDDVRLCHHCYPEISAKLALPATITMTSQPAETWGQDGRHRGRGLFLYRVFGCSPAGRFLSIMETPPIRKQQLQQQTQCCSTERPRLVRAGSPIGFTSSYKGSATRCHLVDLVTRFPIVHWGSCNQFL